MANGKIRFGKQSGGELALVIPDGVADTEVIVPESGVLATQAYADGKTTLAQVKAEISTGSNLVTSPAGAVGYGAGSGGVVTQLTSKSTSVILNKPTGIITMNNAALAAGGIVQFNLLNSLVNSTDTIEITLKQPSSGVPVLIELTWAVDNGLVQIGIRNNHTSSLSEALILNFTINKGANA